MARHRLEPTPATQCDVYDRDATPVLTVDPGDEMTVRTLDAWGHLHRQRTPGEEQPLMFPAKRGHCLVGPIAVRGARHGQVLAVRLDELRPDVWGFTSAGGRDNALNRRLGTAGLKPAFLLWELDHDGGRGTNQHGIVVLLAPFLGVIGVAPADPGQHLTIPPRTDGGGNLDCKELVAGSTLFLPVQVDGALLYLGDGHAAQGDGEVGGNAIETGMTTRLTIGLADDAPVPGVHAVTPTARITFGFSIDLNDAAGDALSAMVTWMQEIYTLPRADALALASTVVDLRVTQVANVTWGVHAVLRHSLTPDGGHR